MKNISKIQRTLLFVLVAFLLTSFTSVFADELETQLSNLETKVFRRDFAADTAETRVKRLELLFLPGVKRDSSMSLLDRLNIVQYLSVKTEERRTKNDGKFNSRMLQVGTKDSAKNSEMNLSDLEVMYQEASKQPIDADVLLVMVDCSSSMATKLNPPGLTAVEVAASRKISKMDLAKNVLFQLAVKFPKSTYLGLRVYGNEYLADPFSDCKQSKLVIPPAKENRRDVALFTRSLSVGGLSPLEYAIRRAVELDTSRFTGRKNILIVADSADTCGGNPVAYVRQVSKNLQDLRFFCIGIGLKKSADGIQAREQLTRLAETTNGKFYESWDEKDIATFVEDVKSEVLPKTDR
jgi:Mg-chelatase subunit ChlD